MSYRRLIFAAVAILVLFTLLASGCSRKVVRPTPGPQPPGLGGPSAGGPVMEQDLQVVQANLKPVYFNYDQYILSPEALAAVQYNAEILRRAPQMAVLLEGHCDERGTAEYNLALGERRARSVAEYLTTLGVANRISTVSYGSELPVDPGHNEEAWAKNRRVHMRVSN
ncbi:MAG: peptidoglycan-associated lipoprotein Pal [Desulfomonilaceae bacterium]|nr:peptidoglycan-associated lipoprotein Pal [Desulfomonilaceae bacterium]